MKYNHKKAGKHNFYRALRLSTSRESILLSPAIPQDNDPHTEPHECSPQNIPHMAFPHTLWYPLHSCFLVDILLRFDGD